MMCLGADFTARPAPAITNLSPTSAAAGSGDFILTVNGSNFDDSSVVRWNNSNRQTALVNPTQLTAQIPAADIAAPGSASVTVAASQDFDAAISNALTFNITPSVRTLTVASTNPASGVSITVSPADNNTQGNGTTQFTRTYNNNTQVTLTAPASAAGNSFQKWQRNGVDFATTPAATVTMDANYTMTAVYLSPVQVTVGTNPAGRSFSVDGTTYTSVQSFNWVPGSSHTIATTSPQSGGPSTEFVWSSWSDGGAISHTVAPTANTSYTANFTTNTLTPTIQFAPATYTVSEAAGVVTVTVTRAGDTTVAAAADCTTFDQTATERRDYLLTLGRLEFAAGETQKTVTVFITNDVHVEGDETFQVVLSNPSVGAALGAATTATVTIASDDAVLGPNPIDDTTFFVTQQYRDFLNRDPDGGGLNFWRSGIESCGADAQCREVKRIDTSAAFFLSIEFQETGYLVYRMYKAAYSDLNPPAVPTPVRLREFLSDTQQIGRGVQVGIGNWQAQLESNKQSYAAAFVARLRFNTAYPQSMTAAQFVDALNANTGGALSTPERDALVSALSSGAMSRAQVLRAVAEDADFVNAEFRRAFVLMQYFGYLRRNPDDPQDTNFDGYNFWLQKLNQFAGDFRQAEMVKAFILSIEYRQRFGQ